MLKFDVKKAALAATLLLTALPANATSLLETRYRNPQLFTQTGLAFVFAGSAGSSFTQAFFTEGPRNVMISFTAVCSTTGTGAQYTSITILVDGAGVYPTNQADEVFCSAVGSTSHATGWGRNTVVAGLAVSPGSHNIQVQVTPHNGGQSRIDNLQLLVWD